MDSFSAWLPDTSPVLFSTPSLDAPFCVFCCFLPFLSGFLKLVRPRLSPWSSSLSLSICTSWEIKIPLLCLQLPNLCFQLGLSSELQTHISNHNSTSPLACLSHTSNLPCWNGIRCLVHFSTAHAQVLESLISLFLTSQIQTIRKFYLLCVWHIYRTGALLITHIEHHHPGLSHCPFLPE